MECAQGFSEGRGVDRERISLREYSFLGAPNRLSKEGRGSAWSASPVHDEASLSHIVFLVASRVRN